MDLQKFFDKMSGAVLEAGELAKRKQKTIKNIGKTFETMPGDTAKNAKDRGAKTIVDEQVQEVLLKAVVEVIDPKTILLDAEEDTPSVKLFGKHSDISLVIDPIDATIEYIAGKDSYSICVGLIENGVMKISLVYFPTRNDFYALAPDGKSYLNKKRISTRDASKIVYKNNRVPDTVVKNLSKNGYKVYDDAYKNIGAADAIIAVLQGKAAAYISHTRQIRDILLGPIVAGAGGYAIDWQGKKLVWPKSGRVPQAIFGVGKPLVIL